MIALDYPYLSPHLAETLVRRAFPVIDTPQARALLTGAGTDPETVNFISASKAAFRMTNNPDALFYTISENALHLLADHPFPLRLSKQVEVLKRKDLFRNKLRHRYPGFSSLTVSAGAFAAVDPRDLPYPCILKPAAGFFSIGVQPIPDEAAWKQAVLDDRESSALSSAGGGSADPGKPGYQDHVIDRTRYVIEEYIDGEEFAVDAWFDERGYPTILGIYQHLFASDEDVSDRIYITSTAVIERNLSSFTDFLRRTATDLGLGSIPVHVELRLSPRYGPIPIEINPLRFGGWCTTADMSRFAYGWNQYEFYFDRRKPDWPSACRRMGRDLYSLIVLDNSTGILPEAMGGFDSEALLAGLEEPLEFRPIDVGRHSVFGFVFARTRDGNETELQKLLKSDLREYVLNCKEAEDWTAAPGSN